MANRTPAPLCALLIFAACAGGQSSSGTTGSSSGSGTSSSSSSSGGTSGSTAGSSSGASGGTSSGGPTFSTLSLFAGQLGGFGTADGVGLAARFHLPDGTATDGAGNLYVADSRNDTIRKIVLATGAVTTLAGKAGVQGDANGTGPAATFEGPYGLASDGTNLYVAEPFTNFIRQIVLATGVVTTLAGSGQNGGDDGVGAAATFNSPQGLCYDGHGNLFVADTENNLIRQIVLATATVSTLAGTLGSIGWADGTGPAAIFNRPYGLACDGQGNLYVADTDTDVIRQIVIATAVVTTIAGSESTGAGSADGSGTAASFDQPQGLCCDGAGNLFVADTQNDTLRQIVLATQAVTTLAGTVGVVGAADATGTAATFGQPQALASDGAGNLYVADTLNATVRKVAVATAAVTTFAGKASAAGSGDGAASAALFDAPAQIATDAAGDLFVADTGNSTIRQISPLGIVTTLAGSAGVTGNADGPGVGARFDLPQGLCYDGAANLYVADTGNNAIREVVVATGAVTTLAGSPTGAEGDADGPAASATFSSPKGLACDGAQALFVADTSNSVIRKIALGTGTVSTVAGLGEAAGTVNGTGNAARFLTPIGLAFDGAGNLYVADAQADTLRKVVVADGATTTLAGGAGAPGSVDGPASTARFNLPQGVAWAGGGILLVADTGNSTLREVDIAASGAVTVKTVAGVVGQSGAVPGPLPAGFNTPSGLALGPGSAPALFVSDTNEDAILELH